LSIFAKGNLDVRDTLHALRLGETVVWNGVNEVLRAQGRGVTARVRHETWTRSDALLESDGTVPAALLERPLPLGAFPPSSQFSQALFETPADAYVLSVQPDICTPMVRHRRDGFLFCADHWPSWAADDQAWLRRSFAPVGLIEPRASMANFARIIERLRARSAAPILIYNVSSVVPGEQVHCHEGLEDMTSTRIRRFNLGLIELSQATGVSIIDVDAIVAAGGADRLKYDTTHLTGEGCRTVAEAVVRVLDDLGALSREAA
jgi:hypothetical protein